MGCLESKPAQGQNDVYRQPPTEPLSDIRASTGPSKDIEVNAETLVRGRRGTITSSYELVETIGKGAFGEVKKGIHRQTGQIVAIKIIPKARQSLEERQALIKEVNILKKLDHPSIIRVHEFYQNELNFYIVTDLCEGKELFDKIIDKANEGKVFREDEAAVIVKQVLSAVSYCHQHQIVHRDLKPENILYESKTNNDSQVKVIDFGASNLFRPNEKMGKLVGTPYYIAPEILLGSYDEKVDIWSTGVILYVLLCGYPPFNGNNNNQIFEAVKSQPLRFDDNDFGHVSKEVIDLLRKMLERQPQKRLSASQCLEHEWFSMKIEAKEIDGEVAKAALGRLKEFQAGQKLHDAVWVYMTNYLLSKDEKAEMMEVFKSIDKNGDGQLSKEELLEGYEKAFGVAITAQEVDDIMNSIDKNKSGFLDYSEFVMAVCNKENMLSHQRLEKTFAIFDKDGSGSISIEELKEIFGGADADLIQDSQWKQFIQEADENGDGEISFQEFKNLMMKL